MRLTIWALAVFGLTLATAIGQPANNNFANRITLTGLSVTTTGSNVGATMEFGENNNPNNVGRLDGTVWWSWTAPLSGRVTLDTIGSDFDTVLGIYTGTQIFLLTVVTANDNIAEGQPQSRVSFEATSGTTYQIQVGGRRTGGGGTTARGNIVLNLSMQLPVILVSPTNGSVYAAGTPVTFTATGMAQTPPIARMEFYRGTTLVGAVTNSPYSLVASNLPVGTYGVYAVLVDSANARSTSAVANVVVMNPGVAINAPADGANLATNTFTISAVAALSSGAITNVAFYGNDLLIGNDATAPFGVTWTGAPQGVHLLRAVGWADSGLMYTSPPVYVAIAQTIVPTGAVWKYLDTGVDQGTEWRMPGFDDSAWAQGPAELGNGDSTDGRLEATVINIGPEGARFPTVYFRHYFVVSNPAAYTQLLLRVLRDDGAVIYLNGTEVNRQNMPTGTITYNTYASAPAGDDGTVYYEANIANLLVPGTNVLAVEVHQNSATSSDLSFDLELRGYPVIIRNQSPVVTWLTPTNKAALAGPASVPLQVQATDPDGTVAFTEFLVDGGLLGRVTNSPYQITWDAPAIGFHTLEAAAVDAEGGRGSSVIQVSIHDAGATPLVQLTSPTNGTRISGLETPTNVLMAAVAAGVGGVASVEFRANGLALGTDATEPYSLVWSNASFGTNALVAVATDGQGRKATSAVATLIIDEPPRNTQPPVVASVNPARGASLGSLTSIQVIFSERVTGVEAADLLVNGVPATAVSGSGSNYTFTVTQPAFGAVVIAWAANHGIADIGWPSSLPFDPQTSGNTWTYDLVDRTPPVVASQNPPAGSTLTNLNQVTVVFSKPVQGVDAADFLINGTPAVGLAGSGTTYTFYFAQPGPGTVNITWAANHGIMDMVSPPNAFNPATTGNTWSYTLDNRTILVASNAVYRFFRGRTEASDPYNAWRQLNFDDSTWEVGPAPFYYDANTPPVYSGNTALNDMRNNYTCVFLRHAFVVRNVQAITNLLVQFRCDDGFAAWINGVEVARYAIPAGEPSYNTLANNAPTPLVTYTYTLPDPRTYLVEGTNLLAIMQFNTSLNSSDLLLESVWYTYLADVTLIPPNVQVVMPPAGPVFSLTNLTVKFSEPVSGVNAADLLLNGVPAVSVSGGSSNDTYAFSFPQPSYGPVSITWAVNHGIADFDNPPKPFEAAAAGNTWQYQLLNPNAPVVAGQNPPAGAQLTNLTQITVIFSKPVTGVDAADLRINGLSATSVSGSGTTYTFALAQPAYGAVSVAWAANHGITDLEMPANTFESARSGNSWSYTLVDLVPPTLVSVTPSPNSQVTNLTQITVRFSEPVTGVDATDLLVNGQPATAVSGSGAQYTFSFPQPNATLIQIAWALGHGITDLAANPNGFDRNEPNAAWSYTTPDTLAPSVVSIVPLPGTTVARLDQITIIFSEPVTGVDAADLLVNSRPARSVTGSGAGPYVFSYLAPSNGVVEVRWAAAANIVDLAPQPNLFSGGEWTYRLQAGVSYANRVIFNEIMHNPRGGAAAREWIELRNLATEPVNLTGWRISRGVSYTFPPVTLPAQGYLVVAADVAAFRSNYPTVTNVVGGWTGQLANGGETLELVSAEGEVVNRVRYASEGDWAVRERGRGAEPVLSITRSGNTATVTIFSHGYTANDHVLISGADQPEYNGRFVVGGVGASTFTITVSGNPATPATGNIICRQVLDNGASGWAWFSAADGFGSSLELVNPALPNTTGQNWQSSALAGGTPGRANSVATNNVAPLILSASHYPIVPRSTDPVTVRAQVVDELTNGVQAVTLFYRNHTTTSPGNFLSLAMNDDGLSGDGGAGDRWYGARLPAFTNGTIIEFYIQATDTAGLSRTWPAPAWNTNGVYGQLANALFQVDNEVLTNLMVGVRAVMTATERATFPTTDTASDAASHITLVLQDGNETDVRYNCSVRIRGAGSRSRNPKNNRINIPNDNPWKNLSAINLNCQFVHAQYVGNVLAQKSGLPAADCMLAQYRVNGVNLAPMTAPANNSSQGAGYGTYLLIYPVNGELAQELWPEDGDGNIYRASIYPHNANLSYLGTDPSSYVASGYYKNSNRAENDWSDLMNLTYAFSQISNEQDYRNAIVTNLNVQLWMRYFAYGTMVNYGETSLFNGRGDDYALYRGMKDRRFVLIGHDFDTIFGQGDTTSYYPTLTNSSIWIMLNPPSPEPNVPLLRRFLTNAAFAPTFFAELKRLCDTTFHPDHLFPFFDQLLTGWGPDANKIREMKTHAFNRRAVVLSQIPLTLTVGSGLPTQSGFAYTTTPNVTLFGQANVIDTRQVLVNGSSALWSAWEGRWTNNLTLRPGLNRVLVQSLDSNNVAFASATMDIWYDTTGQSVSGTISTDTTWLAANGPYNVTGTLTVGSGATLTIQAGTTVYLGSGVNLVVANGGRLLAEGTAAAPIRFTRAPGASTTWGGITVNGSANSPESRLVHVMIEHNNSTAITVTDGTVWLDNVRFGNTARQYLELTRASFVVQNCEFPAPTGAVEPTHGTGASRRGGGGYSGGTSGGRSMGTMTRWTLRGASGRGRCWCC
ncbi:Ig-like domain-containing protein [Fontisphaera persica]|uniref:Ig-like domain-containing protein n=1 Tax=Fontisphaera persica TaxID=2974023 RepID=UPI0024C08B65|nr:Ig-like domain-containing protein [Fontisphaera persica]WCJ59442.1 Ig-like domain-containing protein [Fontisphaera persica]